MQPYNQQRASFSVKEIAERHGVSQATVHRWLSRGLLDSIKIGGIRRVLAEQEADFLNAMANRSGQNAGKEAA